jgi:hypothetical protein
MTDNGPTPIRQTSATKFGAHFISGFWDCPYRWWLQHRAKDYGLVPHKTADPLLIGSGTHAGLEAYYHSGWQDGNYQLEPAVEAVRAHFKERADEFQSHERLGKDFTVVERLLDLYDHQYGPRGLTPEFPKVRVVADSDGHPLIEREYEIDLGYRDYKFTSRIDLVVEFHGYLGVLEHKTSVASAVWRLLARAPMDLQFTGQFFCVRVAHPELAIGGVIPNILIKDWGPKSKFPSAFPDRQPFARSDAHLEKFRMDVVRTLREIELREREWRDLVAAGMEPFEAARMTYVQRTSECVVYGTCNYLPICTTPGREEAMLQDYRPNPKYLEASDHADPGDPQGPGRQATGGKEPQSSPATA